MMTIGGEAPAWYVRAKCRGVPTDLFFPISDTVPEQVAGLCGACPVRSPCLLYAASDPDMKGVWAGTTEKARRNLRRALRAAS